MAVNCAILSYNGTVYFGFSGDVHAAPDLRKLETLLMTSFAELRDAIGIKPPEKKKARTKEVKVVGPAPLKTVPSPPPAPVVSPLEPKPVRDPASITAREIPLAQFIVA
jgi:hypothetical protein